MAAYTQGELVFEQAPAPAEVAIEVHLGEEDRAALQLAASDLICGMYDQLRALEVDHVLGALPPRGLRYASPQAEVNGQGSLLGQVGSFEFPARPTVVQEAVDHQLAEPDDTISLYESLEFMFGFQDGSGLSPDVLDAAISNGTVRDLMERVYGDRDKPEFVVVSEAADVISDAYIEMILANEFSADRESRTDHRANQARREVLLAMIRTYRTTRITPALPTVDEVTKLELA